jgi:hypothetical protein
MTKDEFSEKWHEKKVRLKKNSDYQLPRTEYLVTAALLDYYEDGETIFAIASEEYTEENMWWFTMKLKKEDVNEYLEENFEIL